MPALPYGQDGQSARPHGQILLDGRPTIVDETSFVEDVIQYLARANRKLVFDISPSLLRRFCQAFRDGLHTNEGILLLNPWSQTSWFRRGKHNSTEARISYITVIHHGGVSLNVCYPGHFCRLELHLEKGFQTTTSGDSRFAWLFLPFSIQSSCRCTMCLIKKFQQPKGLFLLLKSNLQGLSYQSNLYHCDIVGCSHKSKRWADLQRHILARHCSETAQYPCSFPGCERGGGNGFPRKDKLKSHFENVHRGRGIPPKQPRALVPK